MVMRVEPDYLTRAVVKTPAIRLAIGSFKDLTSEGLIRHDTDPVAGRLLAGALNSAALMSVLLDDKEKYSIRIDYPGPVRGLLVDANADGRVRGLIRNPHVMESADSVEVACGDADATVAVTRSCEGRILNSGEVRTAFIMPSAALGYFLSVSDQVESEIRCEIQLQPDPKAPVRSAFGVLIQALPGCDAEEFDGIRNRLLAPEAGKILQDAMLLADEKLRTLLMWLLATAEAPEYAAYPVAPAKFLCNCSRERMRDMALQMLGRDDLRKLFSENPNPAVRCQFCRNEYHLSAEDVK